jgi:PAS domain S-box-containing protein
MAKKKTNREAVEYLSAAPNPAFRSLLEHAERGVIIMDSDFVVKWFNAVAARGVKIVTNNRLKVGKSYWDYVLRDANKTFFRNFNLALQGKSISVEKKLSLDNGRVVWVDGRFTPLLDKEGITIGVIYSYKNITRKKQYEEHREQNDHMLKAVTSNENHAFMMVDSKYKVKYFNTGWDKVLPGSVTLKEEAVLFDGLPDDWSEDILGGLMICRNGGKVALELSDPINPEKVSQFHLSKVEGTDSKDFHFVIWGDDISDKVQAQKALRDSESNLRAMVNNNNQSFFLVDLDMNVEAFNRAASRTVKSLHNTDLQVGEPLMSFLPGENMIQLREEAKRAFQGQTIKVEKYLRVNGKEYWFDRHYNPEVLPGSSQIDRITIWSMDITDRKLAEKALRESEKRFKQLASLTPVGIYQTDKYGNTVYMNDSLLRTLGVDLTEALTGEWMERVHPDDNSNVRQAWKKASGSVQEFSLEFRIKHPNGNYNHVIETAQPMYNNIDEYTGFIGTVLDITQQKENQELGEQKALAERSLKFRSDFLASMSHEMRTPLNGILGMSEALLDSNIDAEQRKQLDNIFESAKDLKSIVNEVLDLAKIEAGKTTLEMGEISLEELADTIMTRHAQEANQNNLGLNWIPAPDGTIIKTDRRRLIQVLSNLVRNALKFTEKGSVTIKASQENDLFRFEIRDTGHGIKESELSKLFKEFSQLDHTTAQALEGTGLGLSICKKLVNMLGGEIGVESTVGEGSIFWFTIQSKAESAPLMRSLGPEEIKLRVEFPSKMKVLLVEDNLINQQAFKLMLEKMGCDVTMASDGLEAVRHSRKAEYDIIFMDIQMPRMDGITATRTIKKENPDSDTPIIGLSGNIIDRDESGKLESDMDDMLLKPVVSDELRRMLFKWVAA